MEAITAPTAAQRWMVIKMENNLYRIELIMHNNLPNIDTTGMLMTNEGVAFVKMHPVKINAKPKHEIAHGCWIWKQLNEDEYETLVCSNCLSPDGAREAYHYCPNCGARMYRERKDK